MWQTCICKTIMENFCNEKYLKWTWLIITYLVCHMIIAVFTAKHETGSLYQRNLHQSSQCYRPKTCLHCITSCSYSFLSSKCIDFPYFKNVSWLLLQQWLNRKPHDVLQWLVDQGLHLNPVHSNTLMRSHSRDHTREIT